jgi:DNA polymerase-4
MATRGLQYSAPPTDSQSSDGRIIFLLDYDSFFARCMQQAYPPLRGKPVAIHGPARGSIIIAASTEAKARGVKTTMFISEARRLCPDLVVVASDMDMYADICTRSLRVLTRYTDRVEPFSIDEAFIDMTDVVPRFGDVHMLAQQLKHDLRRELGANITCSIGIAPNRMLAKLVVEFHKPDGIMHVTEAEIPALLKHIKLDDICGIGPRVLRRLNKLGIYSVEQMGRVPRETLTREFGVLGHLYWLWGQGIDLTPVTPYHQQDEEKSMGHTVTLARPVYTRKQFDAILLRLCERTGRRLRQKEFLGRTVSLWVAYEERMLREGDPRGFGGRRTLGQPTDDTLAIFNAAQAFVPGPTLPYPIMQVNVSMNNLCRHSLQLSLMEDRLRARSLQQTLDTVNDRYGEFTLARASLFYYNIPLPDGPPVNGLRKRYAVDG